MSNFKLFSGSANPEFAKKVGEYLGMPVSDATLNKFSDGEISVQITESVRGQDVFIIQPTCAPTNDNLMELLIMVDALKRSSAKSISAVVPYYGYARQDRKAAPRVPISAKLVADLLEAAGITRVVTIDLHAAQIQGFFNIPADNLFGSILFVNYIRSKNLKNPIIASPDIGGVARARLYADKLGYDLVIVDKKREKANVAEVMNIIGEVKGKDVILVDDMVDTAGTLVKAAEVLKKRGATSVMACCTHGVLSGPAYDRIEKGELDELVISDTIPAKKEIKKITVLTASTIIGEAIRRIHNNESVNSIFNN
ncbi:ribose-phosphate pyrophosphokinase [Aliarcobacter butzleri]|jgi:ribose-phosphate pyrophosphokinase|uniref:ribose-phosphate pyrophosphokinase n=1 Tax=Aliarcobacter butzleri TaxID=28197 RepID=UPI00125EB39B|nr:ribose-phosphate pyrophosphokinase [Aliarcobacter butzleri]MCG3655813.1 ribose-phosphate pyrophosphokinase [Aliarcobacter butzleri]MCG3673307.1 ribose-phosphate pyrophosphokinase [Aliarcobacter butzleri]MCG3696025.1 ribose-phosphate pyrophosphokinase [Aliarcobacter butzleri]MCG3700129.1 ribose-phosphate pyrophosphokinase [Aliarcobacter butzleri]MCT7569625.1 ribose-phosphate pyrophosphokinase [Aliarcobacter butzleri]